MPKPTPSAYAFPPHPSATNTPQISLSPYRSRIHRPTSSTADISAMPIPGGYLAAATHVTKVAHVFAFTAFVLILVWVLRFRGGAARLNSDDPNLIFNVHPLVMTLGFILITGEGIMVYKTVLAMKTVRKRLHMFIQLVALGLGILGIYAAFKFHKANTLPDMVSLHSWLGMCTIILFGLQWLFGLVSFWFPKAPEPTRTMLMPFHKSAGLAVFLITVCTAETGFVQMDAEPGTESRLVNFTGLFVLLFALAVSVSVALPMVVTL